ncbi:ABC transporter ATP-binding protein/permease [Deltaproteobacteria bacterium]|nr:ABC transporter ATP-binding protein/permease [Deltaproteobacteria bacterium]
MKKPRTPLISIFKDFYPLKEYFIQNRLALFIGFICLLSVDFLQLIVPLIIKRAIDSLTIKTATTTVLLKYAIIILVIALMIAILRFFWRLLVIGHSRKVEEKLRNRLFQHLETLSLSFYQKTKTGDIMARSINDIMAVRMAAGMGLVAFIDSLILGIAAICFMVYINPYLTLLSLLPAPFVIFLARRLTRRMSSGHENVQKKFSDLTERVRESFAGIRIVKSFSREPWEYHRVESEGKLYLSANMKLTKIVAFFFPMMALFTNLGLAIVLWYGGRLTILDHITTGDFVAFIGYLNLLTWPMMAIGWVTNLFQRGSASMRRINSILEETPEITGPAVSVDIKPPAGEIEFRGISFTYPGKTEYALKNISMTIERGQTVSLVGRVGSGKTTLLNTIPRLLEIQQGLILIDGRNIRDYPLKTLRENVGFVTQDAIIFSDTIRNNVLFGRGNISDETLLNALKVAGIYDEILSLDKGLDTILGERGVTLSGGQRQRLTIARAIIADPPILMIDDSMSMIDTGTEESILNMLLSLREDKTNLIISHRLSTIRRAGIIAVMDNGELVEMGDHENLLKKGNVFARLYKRQVLAQELEMTER